MVVLLMLPCDTHMISKVKKKPNKLKKQPQNKGKNEELQIESVVAWFCDITFAHDSKHMAGKITLGR